jgi:nicotinamidase-related amidase
VTDHVAPHWGSSALIVIDMQADFTGIDGTAEVIEPVSALAEAFRRAGRPIVHIVRLYPAVRAEDVRPPTLDGVRDGPPIDSLAG